MPNNEGLNTCLPLTRIKNLLPIVSRPASAVIHTSFVLNNSTRESALIVGLLQSKAREAVAGLRRKSRTARNWEPRQAASTTGRCGKYRANSRYLSP